MNKVIHGKDVTPNIVGAEVDQDELILYIRDGDEVKRVNRTNEHYVLLSEYNDSIAPGRLKGNNHYKYFKKFMNSSQKRSFTQACRHKGRDFWTCYNDVEASMIKYGFTMYKDMKLSDLSVLSFDIETTGLDKEKCDVKLISNTFRDAAGVLHRRMFAYDSYPDTKSFIEDWCNWVVTIDPDIICGHNIINFDFAVLEHVSRKCGANLSLGRDKSNVHINKYVSQFRKDGSQSYDYQNVNIHGREVIDTFFLSLKYDIGRQYPSYGLKAIVKHEKMDKADRIYWDFEKDPAPWNDPAQWELFKTYCEEDADDALKLFDLMIPQYFYYAQYIPKSFQQIINSATGSQINSFMLRSYMQDGKSIPKGDAKVEYEGAISIGNPGIYKHVYKFDVASLYPSIILDKQICNPHKDPDGNFLQMVEYFTAERLKNKQLAKDTGERFYSDMSAGQKIMINSAYGFLGAPRLNFNYPQGAAMITEEGRRILNIAIGWTYDRNWPLVNADTDSISFSSGDKIDPEEALDGLNSLYSDKIVWEDDGYYPAMVVVKAKNYAMMTVDNNIIIKGSGLKATMKEAELKSFLNLGLWKLIQNGALDLHQLYNNIAKNIELEEIDIEYWCSKKTVTKSVLNPERTNEQRILDAIGDKPVQEGDKIHVFFRTATELCLKENYDGEYCKTTLLKKLYKTVKILEPVLDMHQFPNYALKRNQELLEDL